MNLDSILSNLEPGKWYDIFAVVSGNIKTRYSTKYEVVSWVAPEVRGYDLRQIDAVPGWAVYYHPDHSNWVYVGTCVKKEDQNG